MKTFTLFCFTILSSAMIVSAQTVHLANFLYTEHTLFPTALHVYHIDLAVDNNQQPWVVTHLMDGTGAYSNHLSYYDFNSWTDYTIPTDSTVSSVYVDDNNLKWVGTQGDGYFTFDGSNWQHFNSSNTGLAKNCIIYVRPDGLGRIWITSKATTNSTDVYVTLYNGSTWQEFAPAITQINSGWLKEFKIDSQNNFWTFGSTRAIKYDGNIWQSVGDNIISTYAFDLDDQDVPWACYASVNAHMVELLDSLDFDLGMFVITPPFYQLICDGFGRKWTIDQEDFFLFDGTTDVYWEQIPQSCGPQKYMRVDDNGNAWGWNPAAFTFCPIIQYFSSPLAVQQINQQPQQIRVMPNPATDEVTITCTVARSEPIVIRDVVGRVVYSFISKNNSETISVSNWSNGIYFIYENNVVKGKVVKQ